MSTSPTPSHLEFASLMEAELDALEKFLLILENEQQVLKRAEVDKLPNIARSKSELLVTLSQLGTSRETYLKRNGIESDAASIAQFIHLGVHGTPSHLMEKWEKLLAAAKRAQELNQLNGAMIEAMVKHNQQALAILQDAAQQNGLYGPDGHSRAMGAGRQLGKI